MGSTFPRLRFIALAAYGLLLATNVGAHEVMRGAGDFYAGALHPLTAVEDCLPMLLLGLLAGQNGLSRTRFMLAWFPLAFVLGACIALRLPGLHGALLLNLASAVVLGGLLAAARRLPTWLLASLAFAVGLTHGYGNGVEIVGTIRAPIFISGLAATAFLVIAYLMALADWLLRRNIGWVSLALRVAGSWGVAIGVLALSVAPRGLLFA